MAGLLGDMFGGGDQDAKDEFGMTQRERAQPGWDALIKAGLLAVAGGGNIMPSERAKYIAAAGGAIGDATTEQANLRGAYARQALMAQQIKSQQFKYSQEQQTQALLNSPQVKQMLENEKDPTRRAAIQLAIISGNAKELMELTQPHITGGLIRKPDGSIVNSMGTVIVGPGGTPPTGQPGNDAFDPNSPSVGGTERLNMTPLQGVPHRIAIEALRVARGEIAPPSSKVNPDAPLINQLASQVAGPNGTSFAARQAFEKGIISGGTTNKTVIAPWSAAVQHAQEALEAYDAIGNIDGGKYQQLLNAGRNKLASVSDPNVVRNMSRFENAMRVYAQEIQKLIAGAGQLTDAARHEVETLNNPNASPAQVIGAMQALTQMGHVRLHQVVQDARTVRHDSTVSIGNLGLAPEALKSHEWITNRLQNGPGTANPGAKPAEGGNIPTVSSKEEYDKLPSGTKFKDPAGVEWTKP